MTDAAENPAISDSVAALFASVSASDDAAIAKALPNAAVLTAERLRKEELRRALEEFLEKVKPGDTVEGEGVFIGIFEPRDRDGKSLCKTFKIFAAPEDLPGEDGARACLSYPDMVARLAQMKNWHGHDGANYKNSDRIYKALDTGRYKSEWIIPPHEILSGRDHIGIPIEQPDTILAHWQKGDLANTFNTDAGRAFIVHPHHYISSTVLPDGEYYFFACPSKDVGDRAPRWTHEATPTSCRPVRLVEVKL
jgi:hypothetical protein